MWYIALYLMAIIAANLLIAHFGPSAVYVVAFVFIGLDLTSRDKLHDLWRGKQLFLKMGLLIGAGSLLSYLLNREAGIIALASLVAFAASAIVDAVVYHFLRDKKYMLRINGSNILGAAVDSLVFPTIAFGGLNIIITLGQFVAKILGGFVWSLILRKRTKSV